uniref:Uncharacterized protein n=1 Tax=Arion vulgaris TaxID=1028688 RepID=A0A0B7AGH7_9EUPU
MVTLYKKKDYTEAGCVQPKVADITAHAENCDIMHSVLNPAITSERYENE